MDSSTGKLFFSGTIKLLDVSSVLRKANSALGCHFPSRQGAIHPAIIFIMLYYSRLRCVEFFVRAFCIKPQLPLPALLDPFSGYRYKPEYEFFEPGCRRYVLKRLGHLGDEMVVKVLYHGREDQVHRVVVHVRTGEVPHPKSLFCMSNVFSLAPRPL